MKTQFIPQIIHLKGACAVANTLNKSLASLNNSQIDVLVSNRYIQTLITDLIGRLENIHSSNPDIRSAIEKLRTVCTSSDVTLLRENLSSSHDLIHRTDRDLLNKLHLNEAIYHVSG